MQQNHRNHEFHEQAIMDFRQSIVAELANPYLDHGERVRLIREKASRTWDMDWTRKTTLTEATIKNWLELYRKQGKEGLRPKKRKDSGSARAVSPQDAQVFADYLRENPELTARSAWNQLYSEGKVSQDISSSSLSRLVSSQGMRRQDRLMTRREGKSLKFEFFNPLECVQADCLHGPTIPGLDGKATKAILIAFIDDATRRIVYADFAHSEHSLAFEKGIRHILMAHGRIGRLYVDNGSTFVSLQTSRILDTLQIHLVHSTPHRPQGRGKIERFFRTVRDGFLRPLDVASIKGVDDLNLRFRTWLEGEYHRNPHNGLYGQTPLEAWLDKARLIQTFPHTTDLEKVFYHECHRRVAKDQTVTMERRYFEVPSILIGKKVCLRYNPHHATPAVEVWHDSKNYGDCRLLDAYANTRVRRTEKTKREVPVTDHQSEPLVPAGLVAAGLRRVDS